MSDMEWASSHFIAELKQEQHLIGEKWIRHTYRQRALAALYEGVYVEIFTEEETDGVVLFIEEVETLTGRHVAAVIF